MTNGIKNYSKIPVVIMAGGLGKRARSIDDNVPKPLIPIDGKPILLWELECLISQGYTNIILTLSYKAAQIQDYFGDGSKYGCSIRYYIEETPLGNAGALFKLMLQGQPLSEGAGARDFLLLNADSMFDIDFDRFVQRHIDADALATLFVHPSNHIDDSGLIVTDKNGWVESWLTKEDRRPEFYHNCANAGVHVLSTRLLASLINDGTIKPELLGTVDTKTGMVIKADLDRQILKPLAFDASGEKRMLAVCSPEYVKDMGTPERFEQVKKDLNSGLVHSRNLSRPQKAIFLDRDGTINKYKGFIRAAGDIELINGVSEAIKEINLSGYLAIVVTNQPVIARGEVSWSELESINNKLETELAHEGAYIDAIYICPHHPDKGFEGERVEYKVDCDCRKPKPGLLIKAAQDFNISMEDSWMIGDSWRDIECGKLANCRTVLLNGICTEGEDKKCTPDYVCDSLFDAVRKIMNID